ncbi:hypothetical protein EST38_g11292 [Candolleomyces aberdarensis]|uniref:F-box domain-containing protein n=1 Tax=Candolleomyces aberdarensis TaxID=2316362 RepID=A0A4Q2D582_9AGAR|nr:hypothetical protein EST38_g11292 [Candolleomyces aberdarensis]
MSLSSLARCALVPTPQHRKQDMRLPPELCAAVLNYLQPLEDESFESINLSTLTGCTLVSREFYLIARAIIFANIRIEDDIDMNAPRKLKLIKEAFELNSDLSSLVHSFSLEILEDHQLLDNRQHAQSLYNDPSLTFLLSQFKFLEFFSIKSVAPTASTRVTQWHELGSSLRDAFRHLFRANGRHLKTLCLLKLCVPPEVWITELESLSTLTLDSCPLHWPIGSTEDVAPSLASTDNKLTSPSKVNISYLSPQYLKVLINGPYSGMFRQTKDATLLTSNHTSVELLNGLLSAMSQALISLDFTLKVVHLDESECGILQVKAFGQKKTNLYEIRLYHPSIVSILDHPSNPSAVPI